MRTSGGGAHGSSWFYDADPADNAIQFVEMMTQDQPLKPGTASVKFQDLSVYTDNDYRTSETLAEGTWRLKFDFAFEDSSISLPAGQSFTLNGMDATLDGVTLSPLSIQVDYTVHQELVWSENRESGRENEYDREQSYRYFESLPVVITYTDGTTQDLTNAGGGITPGDGRPSARRAGSSTSCAPWTRWPPSPWETSSSPSAPDNRPSIGRAYTPIKRSYRARPFPCVIIEAAITDRRNPYDDPRRSGPHRHR